MTTELIDEDGDGYADRIEITIKNAGQVESIEIDEEAGTVTIYGVPVDSTSYYTDGGPNDIEARVIPISNFDSSIEVGDTVLYWYGLNEETGEEEWFMESLTAVVGYLAEGSSTDEITIIDIETGEVITTTCDALILRYSMQAGSRPGQVISSTGALDLYNVPFTFWMTDTGYVVGMSRMENAASALEQAIATIEALDLSAYIISEDGTDVSADSLWISQSYIDTLTEALEAAQALIAAGGSDAEYDAATYALGNAYRNITRYAAAGTLTESETETETETTTESETTTAASSDSDSSDVQTGDSANMAMFSVILAAALALITGCVVVIRKRKAN